MPRLTDTTPEADRVLVACFRRMPSDRRWQILEDQFRVARMLHATGHRRRNPGASDSEVQQEWLAMRHGLDPPAGRPGAPTPGVLAMLGTTLRLLDRLGIGHALAGAFAASIHGVTLLHRDAVLVVEPFAGREGPFLSGLGPGVVVRGDAIGRPTRGRSGYVLIDTEGGFSVDVLVGGGGHDRSMMRRAVAVPFPGGVVRSVRVASAEDTIVRALGAHRRLGGRSDDHWDDAIGVLKVQAGRLDDAYLDHWARELGVLDLLGRARAEASS